MSDTDGPRDGPHSPTLHLFTQTPDHRGSARLHKVRSEVSRSRRHRRTQEPSPPCSQAASRSLLWLRSRLSATKPIEINTRFGSNALASTRTATVPPSRPGPPKSVSVARHSISQFARQSVFGRLSLRGSIVLSPAVLTECGRLTEASALSLVQSVIEDEGDYRHEGEQRS
jgi:hypothetical protein